MRALNVVARGRVLRLVGADGRAADPADGEAPRSALCLAAALAQVQLLAPVSAKR